MYDDDALFTYFSKIIRASSKMGDEVTIMCPLSPLYLSFLGRGTFCVWLLIDILATAECMGSAKFLYVRIISTVSAVICYPHSNN